ncbi:hypothetical protein QQ045_020133 [Rhodiola kirilowii]
MCYPMPDLPVTRSLLCLNFNHFSHFKSVIFVIRNPNAANLWPNRHVLMFDYARDAFYACLEKESSKKPTEIATVGLLYPAECKKTRAAYEKQCRSSWVKHFDRDYCAKKKVKRFLDDPNAEVSRISVVLIDLCL